MTWNDITLKQFYDITNIMKEENLSDLELNIKLISSLFMTPLPLLRQWDLNKFEEYSNKIKFIFETQPEFKILDEISYELNTQNGILCLPSDFYNITVGQYMDIDMTAKSDLDDYTRSLRLAAIMLYPKGYHYCDKEPVGLDIHNRMDIISKLPLPEILGILNFINALKILSEETSVPFFKAMEMELTK